MSDFSKRFLIVFILLLFTAFFTFNSYSTKNYSGILYTENIPLIIGNWYGKELGIDERTYEILETKDTIMREYTNSNDDSIILAVVFSQNNRKVAHPPEVCFAGGGWSRIDKGTDEIMIGESKIKVSKLILQKDSLKQYVLYLYKSGDRFTENYYSQQINIILNGILHKDTSSALIRISSLSAENNMEKVKALSEGFTKEILPILGKILP